MANGDDKTTDFPLCTEQTTHRIVAFLKAGAPITVAASAAGVDRKTLNEWIRRGGMGEEPYAEFCRQVEKATAEVEMAYIRIIEEAAQTKWQAAAWYLERRWPERWAKRERFEVEQRREPVRIIDDV